MTPWEERLQAELEHATASHAFEARSAGAPKALERSVAAVLRREQAAGRIRGFAVRCEEGPDALVVEVTYVPPGPRARAVVLRLAPVSAR